MYVLVFSRGKVTKGAFRGLPRAGQPLFPRGGPRWRPWTRKRTSPRWGRPCASPRRSRSGRRGRGEGEARSPISRSHARTAPFPGGMVRVIVLTVMFT